MPWMDDPLHLGGVPGTDRRRRPKLHLSAMQASYIFDDIGITQPSVPRKT